MVKESEISIPLATGNDDDKAFTMMAMAMMMIMTVDIGRRPLVTAKPVTWKTNRKQRGIFFEAGTIYV